MVTLNSIRRFSTLAEFEKSKTAVIETLKRREPDRSTKGAIDEQIRPLLDEINSKSQLLTTSSCAGRIQILGMKKRNEVNYSPIWMYQNHSGITGDVLRQVYNEITNNSGIEEEPKENKTKLIDDSIKHKVIEGEVNIPKIRRDLVEIRLVCQGPILHIATPTPHIGKKLMTELQQAGIKQTMIRSITDSRTMISCTSSINLSIILWLRPNWIMNLVNENITDAVAEEMTNTILHNRELYFNGIFDVMKKYV